ncbi:MAG: proteasome accessory factor PafA2 family protein, partial [Fimbriimonadaceae bacterium]
MRPILAGLDTEYGLSLEGRTVHNQIEDAREFVESTPGDVFCGWDARDEAPRSDLRGFQVERLSFDSTDAQFDAGASVTDAAVTRADRVLPNGARFYTDHGH